MSNMMQAVIAQAAGSPLKLVSLPMPLPAANQVRIKVCNSGVNPLDIKISSGAAPHAQQPLPAILGLDSAGVVDMVGEGVESFKVGDVVFGLVGGVGGLAGSLAQYQLADAALLAKVPQGIGLRQAASIPLVFITAWEGLVDRARVTQGHKVLIHGGAGGVGQMAVQIAKARGADVYATGKARHAETIRSLGAEPIDCEALSVAEYVQKYTGGEGFDIVYDTVGGTVLDNAFQAVKTYSGHVVSCLGWGNHSLAPLSFRGASYSGVFTLLPMLSGKARAHHGEILTQAGILLQQDKLRVLQDPREFDLGQVNEAHLYVSSGEARGKVVIDIA